MGIKAQAYGAGFENFLQYQAQIEKIKIVKQQPEVTFFAQGVAKVTGVAWVDYIGFWHGRGFTFEAKSTQNTERFKAPKDRRHQFETLRSMEGIAPAFYFVYWRHYEALEVYPVDGETEWPFWMTKGHGLFEIPFIFGAEWMEKLLRKYFNWWDERYLTRS
jgi:penicillin-binding protein-related factor A (putative recombinase)